MQNAVTIDESMYDCAVAEAARRGETVKFFVESAVRERLARKSEAATATSELSVAEMRKRTAHFKIGTKPTRDEMNGR